jgi:hypothetical protein
LLRGATGRDVLAVEFRSAALALRFFGYPRRVALK